MPKTSQEDSENKESGMDSPVEERIIFGLPRKTRYRIYGWGALVIVLGAIVWSLSYLRPWRWHTYTDKISVEKVAVDVDPGYVLWDKAQPLDAGITQENYIDQTVISSDGVRMVYVGNEDGNDSNLFLRLWDGNEWGEPRPMRALNSKFDETSPSLSGDGNLLVFTSDRPGGQGGKDVWISKWDGAEYAWPLPLTTRVNTPFDEIDPSITPDGMTVFFASNRPHQAADISEKEAAKAMEVEQLANVDDRKVDYDLYSADVASDRLSGLIVERRLSMLYSLREGALADKEVMGKLGGTDESESSVDKALAFIASQQEEDGRWDITKTGGQKGHDVAATAFSLLAFYGRGERHDVDCRYRDNVKRGLDWLVSTQNVASGDLRGPGGNMYDHGIGALALVEAFGVTKDPDLRPKAQAVIDFIVDSQHEEGGWRYSPKQAGDLSVSGWMVMALASGEMSGIPFPDKTKDGIRNFLDFVRSGKNGGMYGYTNSGGGTKAMNAVGFFCSQLLGSSSNTRKAFESALVLDQSGFSLQDVYYAYYGTLAAYQHQGSVWREWLRKMHREFLKAQLEDGSWQVSGPHAGAMGKVVMTALVTLCLEAHYRYTPLYGLGFEPDPAGPADDVLEGEALPVAPIFRHAKHLPILSSEGNDTAPVVTDHGDFLYFASNRSGGFGGSDIYRSRLIDNVPHAAKNLGEEINGKFDESHPAVRMAGFHLLFNSNRDGNPFGLFDAKSKRVVRRYDYSQMPSSDWFGRNLGLLFVFALSLGLLVYLYLRWFRKNSPKPLQEEVAAEPPAG